MNRSAHFIGSCVGGGPMERLASALRAQGRAASVVSAFSPERWRSAMGKGEEGRALARFSSFAAFPAKLVSRAARERPTSVIPTTNPFLLPAILVASKPLHGRPVVPLVYDLFPDALEAEGVLQPGSLVGRALEGLNRYWLSRADGVVFIGQRMARHARQRYGEPKFWSVLETGARLSEFEESDCPQEACALAEWCGERLVVSYVGNLGRMHDWKTVADAVPEFLQEHPDTAIIIAASGPGAQSLREAWSGLPNDRIRFEPPLSDAAWGWLLRRSDVSLVTLKNAAANTSIPSKTFSAMAAGCAVVAVSPKESDLADVILQHDSGAVVAPGDSKTLASVLGRLASDRGLLIRMQENARNAVKEHYDLDLLAKKWVELLDAVKSAGVDNPVYEAIKRSADVAGAALGLTLASPILAGATVAVFASMGRPVFFRQERPGKDGKPFRLGKFRTMRDARPGEEGPEADAARITWIGRLLRATSVDELPSLWNVLEGSMSLVGPRPLLMRYLDRYSPRQARRHEVRPGVTGWAQVNGRNALSWEEKFEADVWYVEHRSLWLDVEIILKTVAKVLMREGISQAGHATMPEFLGNQAEAVEGAQE